MGMGYNFMFIVSNNKLFFYFILFKGVVMKATAEGIKPYEEETTVAVKMVKKQTDNEVMRALISELKIMVHLGHHLNVVNLLGAVTKNIAKSKF